ncbi:MAG: fasciclin domain-containing protein [Bacteroidaceae bacterium]|nr:fasciclin domain-containing protein [Bacteroidaceae bacterium]
MRPIQSHVTFAIVIITILIAFTSCNDTPDTEYMYTTQQETAAAYLANRPSQFSEFVAVIQRSTRISLDLLGTYGTYTVFAPTNAAVDEYLASRGLTSVDQLSPADCDTLAGTHLLSQSFYTNQFGDVTLPITNMVDHYLTVTCDSDLISHPGEIRIAYYINSSACIVTFDDSVANGVVHTLNRVIDPSSRTLPGLLTQDTIARLFVEALRFTHMDDSLQRYKDDSYTISIDSVESGYTTFVAQEYDNIRYMKNRYYRYTAFVEPDSIYARHGIYTLDDLKAYAKRIYDDVYPEDANVTDPTDRRNSLNRFVSYHLFAHMGAYNQLTPDNLCASSMYNRRQADVVDWYETMMPYSIMKISYPSGTQSGRYINRRGVQARADSRGVFVRGARILPPSEAGRNQTALNGVYHYIDDIIAYDRQTQEVTFNERMRIDATTLSPDFMNSGARGHYVNGNGGANNGEYATHVTSADPETNPNICLAFKPGTVRNFKYNSLTHVHVRNRHLNYGLYQGDEVTIQGMFDFTFKLPPVPEGEYEFRTNTCLNFASRGIIQVYFDGHPCGLPMDMRKNGSDSSIGWRSDAELGSEEAILAYDHALRNRNLMKGPSSFGWPPGADGSGQMQTFRDAPLPYMRRIWTRFHSDGHTEHYVRIQQKLETTGHSGEFTFDYIELCPRSVYNNEYYPEDKF